MFNRKSMSFWAVIGLLTVGLVPQAFAQEDYTSRTQAGTDVTNEARVNYTVNSVPQAEVTDSVMFEVDRVVNMTLTSENADPIVVRPNEAGNTTYTLTNFSNDTIDFALSAQNVATGEDLDGTNTDNQQGSSVIGSVVINGVGSYDSTTGIVQLEAGSSATVTVELTAASASLNGEIIGVEVAATAVDGAGTPLDDTVANTLDGVENVFDDGMGDADNLRDGIISVYGVYIVNSATLAVNKTSEVISDPINGTDSPFAIPGAVIEYCIDVSNSGTAEAESVVLTDALPAEVTFATGADQVFETGTGECAARTTTHAPTQAVFDGTDTVTATFTDPVAASGSVWVSFRVTLN
ncbi:hypothetical protein [Microbulbifer hydrolyticus]|nr:hypothetical protein [Microbulbifer hydrolyticus]